MYSILISIVEHPNSTNILSNMSSLQLLSGYGSSSDSEGEAKESNQGPESNLPGAQSTVGIPPAKKVLLPSAADMFSGKATVLVPKPSASGSTKRSASDAFELNKKTENEKISLQRYDDNAEDDILVAESAVEVTPTKLFKPPQLRRPNTVTEDAGLWTSKKK